MSDKEKIEAAVEMLRSLRRMVGFFKKREICELIEMLESDKKADFDRYNAGVDPLKSA